MRILDNIFKRKKKKRYLTEEEIEQQNKEFKVKYEKASQVFETALENYNKVSCQCSFSRFHQLSGIDCRDSGNSFKSFDTDLLIGISKKYFDISKSDHTHENINEKWTCKKCGSTYEYGWQDFSIAVERQKLKSIELKTELHGKEIEKPIPLYLGLMGHSYPSKAEMTSVDFDYFEKYMKEE